MKSTQAWGWLVAGVLALGLNGFYQDGGAVWAHRAADQAFASVSDQVEPVLALAAGRVDWFAARTNMVAEREETTTCRFATSLARLQNSLLQNKIPRAQSGLARLEAMSAREEAALDRMEANRVRVEAQLARVRVAPAMFSPVGFSPAVCPRVRVQMSVPRVRISVPVVQVGMGPA